MLKCWLWGGILLLLAACAPDTANVVIPPIQPPPQWVESAAVVSLENVAQVSYLGRLDQIGAPTTVFAYSFSPDATRLAGLTNEQLLVWDLISGEVVTHTARQGATQVFFSPDKTELYTVNPAGEITVYTVENGIAQTTLQGQQSYNNTLAYHDEAGLLALGNLSGEVKVWDLFERTALVTWDAHTLQMNSLAFTPDGERLVTVGDDRRVIVWNWREREALAEITLAGGRDPVRLAISPDGEQIAVGTTRSVLLYGVADGRLQHELSIAAGGVRDLLHYSPDGRYLITGGAPLLWHVATGERIAQLPGSDGNRVSAAFSPDSAMLLTSSLDEGVRLWDMTRITNTEATSAELPLPSRQIIAADWTADSRLLTFFDAAGAVYIWGIGAAQSASS